MALPQGANTSVTLGGADFSLDMIPVYIQKKLLSIVKKKVVFHQLGDAETLPRNMGKTIRFVRYERFGLPLTPLSEGETPTNYRQLDVSAVEAVVDQWGDIGLITDVAELTVYHKALQIMIDRFATQASETADREDQRVLLAGNNVIYPDPSYDSRDDIGAADVLTTDVIRRVISDMRAYGVPDFNGDFVGVFDPSVEMDLNKDPSFQSAALYGSQTPLMNGEVGRWMGVRWMRSNHIPVIQLNTNVTATASDPAATSAGSGMASAGAYSYLLTGLDASGFETQLGSVGTRTLAADDMLELSIASLPAGVVAVNLYVSGAGGGAAGLTLQESAIGYLNSTWPLILNVGRGPNANAGRTMVTYSSTGRAAPIVPTTGVKIHQTYILGREAFGVVDLTNIETTLTEPVASDSDPLKQRRKAGWKYMYKAVIKNSNFFRRIESSSNFNQVTF